MTERSIYTKMSSAGHHVYNEIWTPVCGEVLEVTKEPDNALQKKVQMEARYVLYKRESTRV